MILTGRKERFTASRGVPPPAIVQAIRQHLRQAGVYGGQYWRRSEIIEPRFGQLKQHDGLRRWTVWGFEAVKTHWALLCAT